MTLVEIAVQDPEGVTTAFKAGADRLELCMDLGSGGLTPSIGLVEHAMSQAQGRPVHVMVRPRPGDFVYTDDEMSVMSANIRHLARTGVDGIVTGALRDNGTLDLQALRSFVAAADQVPVTLHRAFDLTPDLSDALDQALSLGIVRVLTSGGADSALNGADVIADLVVQAGVKGIVLAGAGVKPDTAADVVTRTGVSEIHASARRRVTSASDGPALGSHGGGGGEREVTDPAFVAALVAAVNPTTP